MTAKTEMITCDNLDNSIFSSPKDLLNESIFNTKKEYFTKSDDDVLLRSQNEQIKDQKYSTVHKS
jgi:hypothetical protein